MDEVAKQPSPPYGMEEIADQPSPPRKVEEIASVAEWNTAKIQ